MMTGLSRRWVMLAMVAWCLGAWPMSAGAVEVDANAAQQALQSQLQQADQLVGELRDAVEAYDQAVKQGAANADQLRDALRAKTMEVSQSFHAKMKLKSDALKPLGARYHDLMKGADGQGGVLADVLAKTKAKLAAKYGDEIAGKVQLIQNQSSLAQKKAPMDVDAGILSDPKNPKEYQKLLEDLGGVGGEAQFRKDLQAALEESYREVGQAVGVGVDPDKAWIAGTTRWDPEAYIDTEVLREGGVAQKSLIQQTADVTKYKMDHMIAKAMKNGTLNEEWGAILTEAARGTEKDMAKVQAVFDELNQVSDLKPGQKIGFSQRDMEVRGLLKQIGDGDLDPLVGEARIRQLTGKSLVDSAKDLIDRAENAMKTAPSPKILKAKFYKRYLTGEDLAISIRALLEENMDPKKLPRAVQLLDEQLANVAGVWLVSLEETEPGTFLRELKKQYANLPFDEADDVVRQILGNLETMPRNQTAVLFHGQAADQIERIRKVLDGGIRKKVAGRFIKSGLPLGAVDTNTRKYMQLGGEANAKLVGLDLAVGVAMAFYETSSIMDRNLPPDEESRLLMNAWVSSIPMVGDFAQGIINGIEAGFEGDSGKAAQSAIFLTIGVAYVVPGAQVPAVVASLGMLAWQVGGSAWDISKDKELIWAWVDSGKWDSQNGLMKALYDARNNELPVPPDPASLKALITENEVGYHTGMPGLTIRETLGDFAQRHILESDTNFKTSVQAINKIYPGFDVAKSLALPLKDAEKAIKEHALSVGDNPNRCVGVSLFMKLKTTIYDKAMWEAARAVLKDAEAEYQAKYMVGEAYEVFKELDEVAARLKLPLRQHVDAIFESFVKWSFETLKSPWDKHSLPRRHVDLARRYRDGYVAIEEQLKKIDDMFTKAGLNPPREQHLTGFLDVDEFRINDLVTAYANALGTAKRDLEDLFRKLSTSGQEKFKLDDPCVMQLFQKLAAIQVKMVFVRDRMLLIDQWTGKSTQAMQSRDRALQQALDAVDRNQPILSSVWSSLSSAFEDAYSWTVVKYEGSQTLLDSRDGLAQRLKDLDEEYKDAKAGAGEALATCVGKVLVGVMRVQEGAEEATTPISGAKVMLKGAGGEITLTEGEPGQYTAPRPQPGEYTASASAEGYQALDGQPQATKPMTISALVPGQPVAPATATIFLRAASALQLTATFTPATSGQKSSLSLALTSTGAPLDPATFAGAIDGQKADFKVTASGATLTAVREFEQPLAPGKHTVQVTIADARKIEHKASADFDYTLSLRLVGHRVDDTGGAPADGKATSGEKAKLLLELEHFEPAALTDLLITCPAGDPRLAPEGSGVWKVASLPPGAATFTEGVPMKVGEVKPPSETVNLELTATVGGSAVPGALSLQVPVYPALQLAITLDSIEDPKADGQANNGDGRAQQGESVALVVTVKNLGPDLATPVKLKFTSTSPELVLGGDSLPLNQLASGASQQLKVPATVGSGFLKPFTAQVFAQPLVGDQPAGQPAELGVRLELTPLPLKLVSVTVEDPASGSMASRNNGDGKLATGEYGFLTFKIMNEGATDLERIYFNLEAASATGIQINRTGAPDGLSIPAGQTVELRFEADIPPDFLQTSAALLLKAHDAGSGREWSANYSLAILPQTNFTCELRLMGPGGVAKPEEITAGAALGYELEITHTGAAPTDELAVSFRYTDVSVVPNVFNEAFGPGEKKTHQGTVKIPKEFGKESFWIELSINDDARKLKLHRQRFEFKLGRLATKTEIKAEKPGAGEKAWPLKIQVLTAGGAPVDAGAVFLSVGEGKVEPDTVNLTDGKGEAAWTPPDNFAGQTTVTAEYSGDQTDPAQPDLRYQPSRGSVQVPAAGKATTLKVSSQPTRPGSPDLFNITVTVTDETGAPVDKGVVLISCDIGAFGGQGTSAKSGRLELKSGEARLQWGPEAPGQTGVASFAYTGDQEDPAQPDLELAPSNATLDLPPSALVAPRMTVSPALIDHQRGIWRLDVELVDPQGKPVRPAQLSFTATGGSFGTDPGILTAQVDMGGGPYEKGWVAQPGQQDTITVTYPGDQTGPGQTNQQFDKVSQSVKLPLELIQRSTVFVVDASGSMNGPKLASAKGAVQGALSGVAADGKEEWALYIFQGCGGIQLRQPFTTNPGDIVRALDFGATGGTPIAAAMMRAAGYLRASGRGQTGRVILLTDGGESCSGKPVEAAKGIHQSVRSMTLQGSQP